MMLKSLLFLMNKKAFGAGSVLHFSAKQNRHCLLFYFNSIIAVPNPYPCFSTLKECIKSELQTLQIPESIIFSSFNPICFKIILFIL